AAASIADAGDHGLPSLDIVDDRSVGRGAEVRLDPPDHISNAKDLAQLSFELGEVAFGAFLAIGDEADRLAFQRPWARRQLTSRSLRFVGRIQDSDDHTRSSGPRSQSTHAPMAAVPALVLPPNQGGMTAPKPPAGPPAATT